MSSLFRACQYEVDIRVTVRDKTFHTVQIPALVFLTVGSFQHDSLKVGTGIRFGQVHRHGFTLAHTGDVAFLLIFVCEFINCFCTILQSPEVLESGITAAYDVGSHDIRSDREVQSAETAWHSHTHQTGFAAGFQIGSSTAGIGHTVIGTYRSFVINAFGIGSDDVATYFTYNFQHFVVAVHCIFKIYRSVVEVIFICIVALFQLNDSLHQRMAQVMLEFRRI